MAEKTITKREIKVERILLAQKEEIAKRIKVWRERNKKYFKGWDSVKAIRILRDSHGRP